MAPVVKRAELPGGIVLPYVEQGDPAALPVVLLHGYAGSWRDFKLVLPHLPSSLHVLVPTLRGHGDATKPDGGYRVRDFAADVAAFLDACDLQAAVIVGASSGGVVARRFAIDHPGRVLGLVLLGTPATLRGKPRVEEMWASTLSRLTDPVDPEMVRRFLRAVAPPSMSPALFEEMLQQSLKMPARAWRETQRGLFEDDSLAELGRVEAPTLVVWGDQDQVASRRDQEAMVAAIPGARLVVYRGAGHTFYYEVPERLAASLAEFVEVIRGRL